jgi:NAD(P)-dependent dehydrogenase (short-subunit alcohol dehydrogenase family)
MLDRAVAEYGRLDMSFNNAGIQVPPSDAAEEPIVTPVPSVTPASESPVPPGS